MKSFPDKLRPQNRSLFNDYLFNRELCKLRQKVVDFLYSQEKGGFDLRSNSSDGQYNYSHIDDKLISSIRNELHTLGWKTKLAYGDTVLFIYDNENELPSTVDDVETIE